MKWEPQLAGLVLHQGIDLSNICLIQRSVTTNRSAAIAAQAVKKGTCVKGIFGEKGGSGRLKIQPRKQNVSVWWKKEPIQVTHSFYDVG